MCVTYSIPPPDRDRNRALLEDWLADDHDVLVPDADSLPDFDLCLVDPPALARHREALRERREEVEPLYLPVLLLTQSSRELNTSVWEVVDDVVETPLPKRQFRARIETHLRTRRLSLDLRERSDQLDRFASFLSHDLRNPLAVAEGYLELAREQGEPHQFEHVELALDRMDALITDALALARKGSGAVSAEPVSLETAAQRAWAMVDTGDATLEVEDGTVVADPDYLDELFENLYRNAVEHGGEAVTVHVGPTASGFYVADDGPGIPEAVRETAFDLGTTTDAGTGLGLAIVAEIARAHDWEVSLGDAAVNGARIEFAGVPSP